MVATIPTEHIDGCPADDINGRTTLTREGGPRTFGVLARVMDTLARWRSRSVVRQLQDAMVRAA